MRPHATQFRSTARTAQHALAALALCALAALGACRSTLDARGSLAPNIDLTQLSLEQLLDLEVIPAQADASRLADAEGRPS